MRTSLLICVLALARLAPAQASLCVGVEGDRITASDLAVSLPGFSAIAADTAIAPAPSPGARRIFHFLDITALGKRFAVEVDSSRDLCFERRMEPLDRDRMLEAMRAALAIPDAHIEIVEISQYPVPRGKLEFPRQWLRQPAMLSTRTPVEWRGNVIYGENRRYTIWARVIVIAPTSRVVAAENLKAGEPISPEKVRMESVETFPLTGDIARTVDEVAGQIPWNSIVKGSEIHTSQMRPQLEINRGDTVAVEVRSGAARLVFTATAESGGRMGDMIAVRNPSSKKLFKARVDGKARAFLDAGVPIGR